MSNRPQRELSSARCATVRLDKSLRSMSLTHLSSQSQRDHQFGERQSSPQLRAVYGNKSKLKRNSETLAGAHGFRPEQLQDSSLSWSLLGSLPTLASDLTLNHGRRSPGRRDTIFPILFEHSGRQNTSRPRRTRLRAAHTRPRKSHPPRSRGSRHSRTRKNRQWKDCSVLHTCGPKDYQRENGQWLAQNPVITL